MIPSAAARRLTVGPTRNLRDVGDYPAGDGVRTRSGLLFRSEAARFTAGADLAGLGLRTVVDLRDDVEVDLLPTGLAGLVPTVLRRPLAARALLPRAAAGRPDPLGELYVALLRERAAELAGIVGELARPGALPALVHCAAGKDRTGVVIALVLAAVGVPDDLVAADYALTSDYLTPEFFAALPAVAGVSDPADRLLHASRPESMARMLRALAGDHGGARAYLVRNGLPDSTIDDLRAALTTRPTETS